MSLFLKPLPCPHCQRPITRKQVESSGSLKAFLKSKPFACPHCQQAIVYPENADTLLSSGLFVAIILSPLFHLWEVAFIEATWLFVIGIGLTIAGIFVQRLEKAPPINPS